MLRRLVDLSKALVVLLYLRMSSDAQNPRSPQQQKNTILATIQRQGKPWRVVGTYIDSGVSGRLVRRRPQFQQMIRDIRSGAVKVDAILVDTFERFGRADELDSLRRQLHLQHGVLVLTADTGFADPTDATGQLRAKFESVRATDENRIKAHNVLRGKRDAAELKHWPGGAPPFGYMLKSVLVEHNGRQEVDHSVLIPDPESCWIIKLTYRTAADRGWGATRIAKMLNADPSIPDKFKPFYASTVDYWINHEIYSGVLVWEKVATDIIDDRRIIEKNDPSTHRRIPDFCEPLVDCALWKLVHELRRSRSERHAISRTKHSERSCEKFIAPLTPGIALKYLLSGLVRCKCGLAMTASSSSIYVAKNGEERRYVSYVCPGYLSGACDNSTRVPEQWLRQSVVELIQRRLFLPCRE